LPLFTSCREVAIPETGLSAKRAAAKIGPLAGSKMRGVRQLPEICQSCRREIRTLERCVVLSTREEKRVGDVTFRESVTEGVCCLECASEG
jgi:hypothetical protein